MLAVTTAMENRITLYDTEITSLDEDNEFYHELFYIWETALELKLSENNGLFKEFWDSLILCLSVNLNPKVLMSWWLFIWLTLIVQPLQFYSRKTGVSEIWHIGSILVESDEFEFFA